MIRGLNVILLLTSIFALVGVYAIKYGSEDIARQKNELTRTVSQQQRQLSGLRADWAYYNQPSYIAPLVKRHAAALGLETLKAEQFGAIADLPMRPEKANDAQMNELLKALDAGVDPIGDKLAELARQ
ncbi:hypothetical protein MNBD_ALPHA12-2315 [hydrothermal vent metagenome]|uniref:Cell division protein FtsL n=1 Tax=hydrothermal vent metagenome TaxID=652676 RepID=A0A3B0TJF8_9ZZZZ